jgi:hypothetical protein
MGFGIIGILDLFVVKVILISAGTLLFLGILFQLLKTKKPPQNT